MTDETQWSWRGWIFQQTVLKLRIPTRKNETGVLPVTTEDPIMDGKSLDTTMSSWWDMTGQTVMDAPTLIW